MRRLLFAVVLLILASGGAPGPAAADQGYPYPDMQVHASAMSFKALIAALAAAVKKNEMGLVTKACGSCGAKNQGFDIPGNYVAGVFRNDFARRTLAVHVPAGIEYPIRFYITENADKTATLAYRRPSAILAAYEVEGLAEIGAELDTIFAAIAADTVQ